MSMFDWEEPVTEPDGAGLLAAAGGGPPASPWLRLRFTMEHQSQDYWCWAATATSVALFRAPTSGWTQCKVAGQLLNRQDCCGSNDPNPCNQSNYLDQALSTVSCFNIMTTHASSDTEIDTELQADRSLPIRVGWAQGGGHFLAVVGISVGTPTYVAVDDPWFGQSDVDLAALNGSYEGSGTWTHSYFTT